MTSPYNTRLTRSLSAAAAMASTTTASSDTSTTTTTPVPTATSTPRRHFCVVLTNNPRMIQTAQRWLQTMPVHVSTPSTRQQQQLPHIQMQQLPLPPAPATIRARRRRVEERIEQQVPTVPLDVTAAMITTNMRAYENEIETDFRAQVLPILQLYLQKTQRQHPINTLIDMSNYVEP